MKAQALCEQFHEKGEVKSIKMNLHLSRLVNINDNQQKHMKINGNPLKSMKLNENPQTNIKMHKKYLELKNKMKIK